ncbi:MAG: TrkH family potassium uptake protein [Gammaproteobacteria bacterium]|nr:TrkH family potassium uptake protein [Gammaproteobacteria bacterium]
MQLSIVSKTIGLLLMIFSFTQLPPILVSYIQNDGEIATFITAFVFTFVGGLIFWFPYRQSRKDFKIREGVLIVVCFWLVLSLFATTPFLLTDSIGYLSFSSAFFESMSGLTTTGATVIDNLDQLPKSILYYRQQLQWLGGMGIIVLAVAILPLLGVGGVELYHAESSGISKDRLTPKLRQTALMLWKIYIGLTIVCALSYMLAGMDIFDAIGHSFSTVAIGGFSTHNESIGYFNSCQIEIVAMIFMLLAGVNFSLHFVAWSNLSINHYWKDSEFKAYAAIITAVIIIVVLLLIANNQYDSYLESIRHGAFQAISIATTTGFASQKFSSWVPVIPTILIIMSFVGACVGSTGGGIKVVRVLVMFRLGIREIKKYIHPNAQVNVKLNHSNLAERTLTSVLGFFSLYIISFVLILTLLMLTGMDQVSAFSSTAASMNNLGPGLGSVAENYSSVSDTAKWILSISMLIGRLEVLTLIALFHKSFWRY